MALRLLIGTLLTALLTVGCTKKEATNPRSKERPPQPERVTPPPSSKTSEGATSPSDASQTQTANQPVAPRPQPDASLSAHRASVCPWDIKTRSTTEKYGRLGIAIDVNCVERKEITELVQADLDTPLNALDEAYEAFAKAKVKPTLILIGLRHFHDSNAGVIQISARREFGLELGAIETLITLYGFETTVFDRKVVVALDRYLWREENHGHLNFYGGTQMVSIKKEELQQQLDVLLKYKDQILALREEFPLVRLSQKPEDEFLVSGRYYSYTFNSKSEEALQAKYFKYLATLLQLRQEVYPDILVQVDFGNRQDLNFDRYGEIIKTAAALKPAIVGLNSKDIKRIQFGRDDSKKYGDGVTILSESVTLNFPNIYGHDGKVRTASEVEACLKKMDAKFASIRCDLNGVVKNSVLRPN